MSDHDADIERLRHALRSENRHERAAAAIELGHRGVREMLEELDAVSNDPDDLVAVAATYACWQLGSERITLDRAIAGLDSADEETMQAAVQVLCQMGDAAVSELADRLQAGSPHDASILRILGDIGGEQALEVVRHTARIAAPELAEVAPQVLDDWE